eukprot:TRINITY_DN13604_c0_g1_i2.p2 TRINITY_DN13604_c0_g1~~TRINITY_DN13604_c0_g1_i2.p2  ORF type:complete len:132 (-),score=20.83 TRINITY_DN13604_c0_g1_i2:441-836(-)
MPGEDQNTTPAPAGEGQASTVDKAPAATKTLAKESPVPGSLPTDSQQNGHVAPGEDANGTGTNDAVEASAVPSTAHASGQAVPALCLTEGEYRSMMGQFLVSHQQRESFVDTREEKKNAPPISSTVCSPKT